MCLQSCILFSLFILTVAVPSDYVIVSTMNGKVRGMKSVTENNQTFYLFLGMRYALPPVGNLRFRVPQPASKWSGVYNATQQGHECLQTPGNNNSLLKTEGDEDCLFINVYTTQLPYGTRNSSLPVLVWIHGGGFIYYSGNLDVHGADRFLDHGVVVVSLNYRLGVFGFLSTEDSVIPGNYGLKDQLLALQWVQQNIASFGGDPSQVTIFGQSAGAASVHYLRQSKRAGHLFHRVIADSGNTMNPWSIARNARQLAFRIGLLNGIWTVDSKTLVEQLRKVDAKKLQQSTVVPSLLDLYDPLNGLPWAPTLEVESNEAVYTKYSYVSQEGGNFNLGALLHGFNSLEVRDFVQLPWYGKLLLEQYNIFPGKLTPLDMNANYYGNKMVGQNIRSYYFQNKSVSTGPGLAYYLSDNEFVRGIVKSTQLESQFSDVYLYRFSYTGGALHANSTPEGVSHAEELQFLFLKPEYVQRTRAAQLTVQRMVEMWTNFAKTGNPTPRPSAAVNVKWPLSNATGDKALHYLDIGDELIPNVDPEMKQMQFWESQYSVYGYPPYNTY